MAELRFVNCQLRSTETLQWPIKLCGQLQQPRLASFEIDGGEGADVSQTKISAVQAVLDQLQQLACRATPLTAKADDQRRPGGFRIDQDQA